MSHQMSQIETAAAGKVGGVSGRVDIKLARGKQPVVLAPRHSSTAKDHTISSSIRAQARA